MKEPLKYSLGRYMDPLGELAQKIKSESLVPWQPER